jgi:DNA processing protein
MNNKKINHFQLLRLISVPGLGIHRIRNLVNVFGTPEEVFNASIPRLCEIDGIDTGIAQNIKQNSDFLFSEKQISGCDRAGFQLLSYWDSGYPDILKKIYDPPLILYVKGSLNRGQDIRIAIVGTRNPSAYGKGVAKIFAQELTLRNIPIVSGMARGIDSIAHQGCLKAGGRTIAVLGSGLNVIYPPENKKLFDQISENGAVVSEFPLDMGPQSQNFPKRNRIISGLCLGTLVVEAGERSGALITAYQALEQGREVFAIPGMVNNQNSKGTHKLIKEGAKLVETVDDITVEFPHLNDQQSRSKEFAQLHVVLTDAEKKIWEILSTQPKHIDAIASEGDMSTSESLSLLLSMELKDCVKQLSGMMFIRN